MSDEPSQHERKRLRITPAEVKRSYVDDDVEETPHHHKRACTSQYTTKRARKDDDVEAAQASFIRKQPRTIARLLKRARDEPEVEDDTAQKRAKLDMKHIAAMDERAEEQARQFEELAREID